MEDKKSLTSLKDIMNNLFSEGNLPFNCDDGRIWKHWEELVGPMIARHAQPTWIQKKKLRVTVSDPIWLQELKFVENDIIEKINQHLGRKAVEKIDFRMGSRG
jgi:predicted nucleic acid-binding Zn ribbon protein